MSDKELWAVYLDCALLDDPGHVIHTIPLGRFIDSDREWVGQRLASMLIGDDMSILEPIYEACVEEDELPHGYKFQTYYVARYFDDSEVRMNPEPIAVKLDHSVHPEGCTCSQLEILKIEGDSITIKRHDVSPCTISED